MNILALEPYYGGSHQAFLDGWSSRSRHTWDLLTLPDRHWKWRMRHAAMTFADQLCARSHAVPDLLFASDMLDVATFLSLSPPRYRSCPLVLYFHENQLTYPDARRSEVDYHFAFTNLTSALAAQEVWFNSEFHRTQWLNEMEAFLARMPDHRPPHAVERVAKKARVFYPGIDPATPRPGSPPEPLHILWAARWEADKDPQTFFEALRRLREIGVDFKLSVVGGSCVEGAPDVFGRARQEFADQIVNWGFVESREAYDRLLRDAHVVVSTAVHEFFGIAVAEAAAAGAFPLVPERLAYPEVFRDAGKERRRFFYDGSSAQLADRLADASKRLARNDLWSGSPGLAARAVSRFGWPTVVPAMDTALEALV